MNNVASMTGFGHGEYSENNRSFTVEIKSVNNKYLDLNIRLPKKLLGFESRIRTLLKEYMERGKVDVFINFQDEKAGNVTVSYHPEVAREYIKYLKQMSVDFGLENDVKISSLSRYPEVLTLDEHDYDEDELWPTMEKALRAASVAFRESRLVEGKNLAMDIMNKLTNMSENVSYIESRCPEIVTSFRENLYSKIKELIGDVALDDSRLLTEVTIYADKVALDEELVRLKSHIEAVRAELSKEGSIGRKLDFLAQEMNRESNTILSKSDDIEISNRAIELKTDVEKIREQIQNIE